MMLLFDLKSSWCRPDAALSVKEFPSSLGLADRLRGTESRSASDLSTLVTTSRMVMVDEIQARVFTVRASNTRLVQCYMSKQMKSSRYLTAEQDELAKTCYMAMLRNAVAIAHVPTRSSPPRAAKVRKIDADDCLFFGAKESPAHATGAATEREDFDPVTDEMKRWASLEHSSYKAFFDDQGLLNEFAMCL